MTISEKLKKLINSNFYSQNDQYFKLIIFLIFLPIIIFFYLPFFIFHRLFIFKKIILERNYNKLEEILEVPKDLIKKEDRKYDLVLFGVTGYTGRFCYDYLIKNYPNVNFAISGRNKTKIQNIINNYEIKKDILICDTSDYKDLIKIIKDTKVVITACGPFYQYGNPILNICSAYGTDYCDIAGENYFLDENISKYDNLANETGARIINCCGLDCLPYDITTFMMNKIVKENDKNDKIKNIKQFNYIKCDPSGTTLKTIIGQLEMKVEKITIENRIPILKLLGKNEFSKNLFKNNLTIIKYNEDIKQYLSFTPLSIFNSKIVNRSNNLLNYNNNLQYEEGVVQKSLVNSIADLLELILTYLFLSIKTIRDLFLKFKLIPNPGEGNKIEKLEKNFLDLVTICETEKNKKFVTNLKISKDPGYIETGKMLAECGLTFIFNNDKISKKGGIHTTASCFGEEIFKRLESAGFEYKRLD